MHCESTSRHASGYISALILRQFCGFTAQEAINYWDLGTEHRGGWFAEILLDGAQWVLEGIKDKQYKIADRWSPQEGDSPKDDRFPMLR